jgi:hypothetical protein
MFKFPLQIYHFNCRGELESESLQKNGLMGGRARNTAFTDIDSFFCGEDDIDQGDVGDLFRDFASIGFRLLRRQPAAIFSNPSSIRRSKRSCIACSFARRAALRQRINTSP